MAYLLFFSPIFLCSTVIVSLALMILLTVVYAGDRKQWRLFTAAWFILIVVETVGVLGIRTEGNRARQQVADTLNALADHLAISLQEHGTAVTVQMPVDDPEYHELMDLLSSCQDNVRGIGSLFTFYKGDDGCFYFLLSPGFDNNRDGRIEGEGEDPDLPGTLYDIRDKTALRDIEAVLRGENVISSVPYHDDWGSWLTAYRPLKDAHGNVVAVFGVDYWADDWNREILRARRGPCLFFYTFLFFFYLQLFYFIRQRREERNLRYYSRELERMLETTEEIRRHQNIANQNKRVVLENMYREVRLAASENNDCIREFESLCLGDRTDLFRQSETALKVIHRTGVDYLTLLDSIHNYLRITVEKTVSRQEMCQVRQHLKMLEWGISENLRSRPGLDFEMTIDENVPETMMIDHVRFRTIMVELLGNAIKESREGTIRLDVSIWDSTMEPADGEGNEPDHRVQSSMSGRFFLHDEEVPIFDQLSYLKVEIGDTAPKISEPLLVELFHPFCGTGPSTSGQRRPIKFGLSMARNIARIAGGKLRLVNRDAPGNTFLLLLPAVLGDPSQSDGPEADPATPSGVSLENYRILIVDSNAANQIFVETILNNAGARTEMTDNGDEAVKLLLEERRAGRFFDLVVLDNQLSGLNGHDTATAIRNFGFMRPIVFIGSSSDKTDFQVGESDAVLSKPVDRKILIQTILRLTDGRRRAGQWRNRQAAFQ